MESPAKFAAVYSEAVEVMGGVSDYAGGTFLLLHHAFPERLLQYRCQPAQFEGEVSIPDGVQFWTLDSGVRHDWGQERYEISRCAAFMGRRIVQTLAPRALLGPDGQSYLANLGSDRWRALRLQVPKTMNGAEFIAEFGERGDDETVVNPHRNYEVRLAAEYHVYEADRVRRFAELLTSAGENPGARADFLAAAGDLMIQAHFSLDHRCQLGAPETDLLMNLAREAGPERGIYGARVTGCGAGGKVVVLADAARNPDLEGAIRELAGKYQTQTGVECRLTSYG